MLFSKMITSVFLVLLCLGTACDRLSNRFDSLEYHCGLSYHPQLGNFQLTDWTSSVEVALESTDQNFAILPVSNKGCFQAPSQSWVRIYDPKTNRGRFFNTAVTKPEKISPLGLAPIKLPLAAWKVCGEISDYNSLSVVYRLPSTKGLQLTSSSATASFFTRSYLEKTTLNINHRSCLVLPSIAEGQLLFHDHSHQIYGLEVIDPDEAKQDIEILSGETQQFHCNQDTIHFFHNYREIDQSDLCSSLRKKTFLEMCQWALESSEFPDQQSVKQRNLTTTFRTLFEVLKAKDCVELDDVRDGLEYLDLSDWEIVDITPLSGFTSLKGLYLNSNYIIYLNGLSRLTGLEELWINSNEIHDLSPIEDLFNLTKLIISDNYIEDISPLQNLNRLTVLGAALNSIDEPSPLKQLSQLKELRLAQNQFSSLAWVRNLSQLEILNVASNTLNGIDGIDHLVFLRELDLSLNPLSKEQLRPLQKLQSLRYLRLSGLNLTDVSFLSPLAQLEELYLDYNQVSNLEGIDSLVNLVALDLSSNTLSSVIALAGLAELVDLELSYNPLIDISSLASLAKLTSFSAWGTPVAERREEKTCPTKNAPAAIIEFCKD